MINLGIVVSGGMTPRLMPDRLPLLISNGDFVSSRGLKQTGYGNDTENAYSVRFFSIAIYGDGLSNVRN